MFQFGLFGHLSFFGARLWRSPAALRILLLALAVSQPALSRGAASNTWSLVSPGGTCEIVLSLDDQGRLTCEALRGGKVVLQKSPLGIQRDDQHFERALAFERAGEPETRKEDYQLFAGPRPHVSDLVNHRRIAFRNANKAPIEIELAASDQGVAFRYVFTDTNEAIHAIRAEETGFQLPLNALGWLQPYHAASLYTPAYEDFYFAVTPGESPPDSRAKARGWAFPALFRIPDAAAWVLLTESGTDESYCGCHLASDSSGGLYRIAFPLADEFTKGHTNKFGPEPRWTLPWTMPWRVILLAGSPCEIASQTLVTDLAAPSQIDDTSWIRPGRASWAWWSYPEEPATKERFDEFTDLAVKMGWEYTLFDAGWWRPGLKPIAAYALSKKITPLAWLHAGEFYDPQTRAKKLDEVVEAGIRGVKVDFWCSDRQEAIAAQEALMREAAVRKLVVNLHGCTIPRGWQRTWPNFLTCEAVLGRESYFYESRYTEKAAELDTVLPFTRNAIGPMDLTPVSCSPKKYKRLSTEAHELAAALIFTSGIIHYADKPEFFESLPPQVLQVFRDAPAQWEETRCLAGEPGREVIFARRSGKSWFIAGINGTSNPLPFSLDLADFATFPHRLAIVEGADADTQVTAAAMEQSSEWNHTVPSRGGFILRFDR